MKNLLKIAEKNLSLLNNTGFTLLFILTLLIQMMYIPNADELLFSDAFKSFSSLEALRSWGINTAPSYFPDSLILLFFHLAIPDWQIALLAYHTAYFFILLAGALILNKCLGNRSTSIISAGFLLILTIIAFYALHPPHKNETIPFRFLTRAPHVGIIASTLFCLGMFFKFMKKPSSICLILYSLCIILTATSDFLFQIIFTLPMLCLLLYLLYRKPLPKEKISYLYLLIITFSSAIAGFLINAWFNLTFFYQLPKGIPELVTKGNFFIKWNKIDLFWNNFITAFMNWTHLYPEFITIALCCLFLPIVLTLTFSNLSEQSRKNQIILIIFTFLLIFFNLSVAIITGQVRATSTLRYLWAAFFLPIITTLIILESNNISHASIHRVLSIIILLTNTLLLLLIIHVMRAPPLPILTHHYPSIIKCLDENKDSYRLKDGFAEFWLSRRIQMYSKNSLKVSTLKKDDLEIRYWINDLAAYKNKDYNFIVIDPEPYSEGFKREIILRKIGKPDDTFNCEDRTVYIYRKDQLNKWYARIAKKFPVLCDIK